MKYPGGKGGAGVYQTIINLIPPHSVYVEAFAGGANVFERKAPAEASYLIERDPVQADELRARHGAAANVITGDVVPLLARMVGSEDLFVYLDPPYVLSTRTKKAIYAHEMSDADHVQLVSTLAAMSDRGIKFMLSGYRNAIYDEAADANGWHRVDFQAMTRGGVRTESLWMNYAAPAAIASYDYVGSGFRERERIKRKVHRWIERVEQLPALERAALLAALRDLPAAPTKAAMVDRAACSSTAETGEEVLEVAACG